jgi:hypothetical protein
MVKEYEMKKAAAAYSRTKQDKWNRKTIITIH